MEVEAYHMAVAKVDAFFGKPAKIFERYGDLSDDAHLYARAIAHYKKQEIKKANELLDTVISHNPVNKFYIVALKGQFAFELGDIDTAMHLYEQALSHLENPNTLRVEYAKVLLASKKEEDYRKAVIELERVLENESLDVRIWTMLSSAHYKLGNPLASIRAKMEVAKINNDKGGLNKLLKTANKIPVKTEEDRIASVLIEDIKNAA